MPLASPDIQLALGIVPSLSPGKRPGKQLQRQVAAQCIASLRQRWHGPGQPTISVSHSRTRVIVGMRNGTPCSIGVDLEYADPTRNWPGIIEMLSRGSCVVGDRHHAALVWTAYEAVFKAVGHLPTPSEIHGIGLRCKPVADNLDLIAVQHCGPILLVSMWLPDDRSFALTVAVPGGSAAEQSEGVTFELHTVGSEGDDSGSTVSMRIPTTR